MSRRGHSQTSKVVGTNRMPYNKGLHTGGEYGTHSKQTERTPKQLLSAINNTGTSLVVKGVSMWRFIDVSTRIITRANQ